ncbi:TetR/AcrR family transcriptional regulator [Paenarthrobacter aurescens]|uniref:Transcriptional regulator, TetR family n=1 Tax=Paenarthrobacter aurescens (strain TC1) TaxID=290340 RepID=A1R3U6_PAEAT|nr:TetR/AcrR family transcriptional regulator [Paenarthrobacter aurescens]ABM08386.1 putative transcriptional regulator, TetR family [Paenarthrobacter aurescens TC1]
MASSYPKGLATRQRLVDSMLELIQLHGYHGTGLNTVLARSGAPKGSLYFHFPEGKTELGIAAVGLAGDQFAELIGTATTTASSPSAAVDALVAELKGILEASDYQAGCPVSSVALDAGSENEPLREACGQVYDAWVSAVSSYLSTFGLKKEQAQPLATSMICLVEGSLILSRAYKSTQPLDAAAGTLKMLMKAVHSEANA